MTRLIRTSVRATILLPACLVAGAALVEGQTPAKPAFDLDLSTPDVPAFTILGVSPTQIERPTTPKAFGLSLLSATTDGTSLVPNKYAVVVSPYWMQHAAVTLDKYVRPGVEQSLVQTLTVSFATARSSAAATANSTDIALGLSASLWAGHGSTAFAKQLVTLLALDVKLLAADSLSEDLAEIVKAHALNGLGTSPSRGALQRFIDGPTQDSLKEFLNKRYGEHFSGIVADQNAVKLIDGTTLAAEKAKALAAAEKALDAAVDSLFASDPLPLLAGAVGELLRHVPEAPTDAAAIRAAREIVAFRALSQVAVSVKALKDAAESGVKATVAGVRSEDKLRVGWMLGLTGAIGSRVPDERFADARQLRWAVWASPAYRSDGTNVDVIGVVKWIQRDATEGPNLFDAGVRVVKQAGGASFSAEYLGRTENSSAGASAKTERATVNFDYKIVEKVFVTAAFGKDFADPSAGKPKGGLLSILGVTIGLSKSPSVQAP